MTTSDTPAPPTAVWTILPDLLFAVTAYVLAYRLRFLDARFDAFLASSFRTLPVTVGCQLAALIAAGVYRPRSRYRFVSRLLASVVVGTMAAALLTRTLFGFEGVSRITFLADATFLAAAAITWRGIYLLWHSGRATHGDPSEAAPLVDRSQDAMSMSATFLSMVRYRELLKNLVLKDLKLKYRGSVFGFLWSLVNPLLMIVGLHGRLHLHPAGPQRRLRLLPDARPCCPGRSSPAPPRCRPARSSTTPACSRACSFPRAILPIATVLFNLAQYLLTVLGVPAGDAALVPGAAAPRRCCCSRCSSRCRCVFTIGVALILATATAFFRDVRHLLEVALARAVLDDADRLRAAAGARAAAAADPAQPDVAVRRRLPADLLLPRSGRTPTVWLVAMALCRSARSSSARCSFWRSKTGSRSSCRWPVIDARGGLQAVPAAAQRVGRAQGPLPRPAASEQPPVDRGVLGAAGTSRSASTAARRSAWSAATDRARARS